MKRGSDKTTLLSVVCCGMVAAKSFLFTGYGLSVTRRRFRCQHNQPDHPFVSLPKPSELWFHTSTRLLLSPGENSPHGVRHELSFVPLRFSYFLSVTRPPAKVGDFMTDM
jgi:hypothetical protein